MTNNLIILSLLIVLAMTYAVFYILRKNRMNIKYALLWLFAMFILFLSTIIPGFLDWFSKLLGFKVASNMILAFLIGILMIISLSLTVIVSSQKEKIRILIQEVSILKEKVNNEKIK